MLSNVTLTVDEHTAPAVLSGILLLCALGLGRKQMSHGAAVVTAHAWYGLRRFLKGISLNFKSLAITNLLCGAGLVSGVSYLPLPLMYVVGLGLPLAIGVIVTLTVALIENSDALRDWRYKTTSKSKYVTTRR